MHKLLIIAAAMPILVLAACAPRNVVYARTPPGQQDSARSVTEIVPDPSPAVPARHVDTAQVASVTLQAGLFTRRSDARWRLRELIGNGISEARVLRTQYKGEPAFIVVVGPLTTPHEIAKARSDLAALGVRAFRVPGPAQPPSPRTDSAL